MWKIFCYMGMCGAALTCFINLYYLITEAETHYDYQWWKVPMSILIFFGGWVLKDD